MVMCYPCTGCSTRLYKVPTESVSLLIENYIQAPLADPTYSGSEKFLEPSSHPSKYKKRTTTTSIHVHTRCHGCHASKIHTTLSISISLSTFLSTFQVAHVLQQLFWNPYYMISATRSGIERVTSHTFSALWLRSSVVSVLISLISDTGCIAPLQD